MTPADIGNLAQCCKSLVDCTDYLCYVHKWCPEIETALGANKLVCIREVAITHTLLYDTGAALLANSHICNLVRLELFNAELGPRGIRDIARIVARSPCLRVLDIGHNKVRRKGMRYIAETLPQSLRVLHVSGADLYDRGFMALARQLPRLHRLRDLDVSDNHISDRGFCRVPATMALRHLDISDNDVTRIDANLPRTLRYLNLSNNAIMDDELRGLQRLRSLTVLDLSGIGITEQGSINLSHTLPRLRSLRILELCDNPLSLRTAMRIINSLRRGRTLRLTKNKRGVVLGDGRIFVFLWKYYGPEF